MASQQAAATRLRSGKVITQETLNKSKTGHNSPFPPPGNLSDDTMAEAVEKMAAVTIPQEQHSGQATQHIREQSPTVNPTSELSEARMKDKKREEAPYLFAADDPEPLGPGASKKEYGEYIAKLKEYSNGMFAAYLTTKSMRGQAMWQDFVTEFRPHTIRTWTRVMICEWKALLKQRGIDLDPSRSRAQLETIIDILYWEDYNPHSESDTGNPTGIQATNGIQHPKSNGRHSDTVLPTSQTSHENPPNTQHRNSRCTTVPDDPDGGDDSSSDEDGDENDKKGGPMSNTKRDKKDKNEPTKTTSMQEDDNNHHEKVSSEERQCINNLVKAYVGQPTYAGGFLDDLETVFEAFEGMADVCDLTTDKARLKAIPIMLKGAAFRKYSKSRHQATTYLEAKTLLRNLFTSKERQTRLLKEWKSMRLTEAMEAQPDKSEMDVFKTFVDKATSMQQQLHISYQDDRQLRDMLSMSVDLPRIQELLSDRQPRTTHQLVERVANRLSHRPKTAGATIAFLTNSDSYHSTHEPDASMYTLGQRFGGEARRNIKSFIRPKGRGNNYPRPKNVIGRRPLPRWLQGVKGCMVCGGSHRPNEQHSRDEVTAAVKQLKLKHPTAMLSQEEETFIADLFPDENQLHETEAMAVTQTDDDLLTQEQAHEQEEDFNENHTEMAYMASDDMNELEMALCNSAFYHGRTVKSSKREAIAAMHSQLRVPLKEEIPFNGLLLDTCCNRRSVMGEQQYHAYCREFNVRPAIKPIQNQKMRGIGGNAQGVGLVLIDIPFNRLSLTIPVIFLLLKGNQTALLSMRDMKTNGLELSIQAETISFGHAVQPLLFENFFLKHIWGPEELNFVLYTESELRTIHRSFGHPSISATERLIKRAQAGNLDVSTRKAISEIANDCRVCQRNRREPRRFKLTVGMDEMRFNHTVQIDTMFLNGRPVCHMVDLATHFCAAQFLKVQTTAEIWRTIQSMWTLVYLGPPDHLHVDQGSNYTSHEMAANCHASGISLKEAPIETPGAIGTVERYHGPLRAAFNKLRDDLPSSTTDHECLKLATYAVNSTIGPEGLCPILLVFGAFPRPIRVSPSPTQLERATALSLAMAEVEKEQTRRRIAFGLRYKGPKSGEDTNNLEELPAGAKVAIYRSRTKKWEGPFIFVSVNHETAVVQTRIGRRIFRSTCVRPWLNEMNNDRNRWDLDQHGTSTSTNVAVTDDRKKKSDERKDFFKDSRRQEIRGLIDNGTFKETGLANIPKGTRIFGSRFVDEVKLRAEGARRKSRLIAQNYCDEGATEISTKAPTVQRFTQRMILSLAASLPSFTAFTRDVTQAYIQSRTQLERPVYIRPPIEMELPQDTVLQVVKPLYGIPESGLHWYLTYLDYHEQKLGMKRSAVDPCFLLKHDDDGQLMGAIILQVDDSLAVGSECFLRLEQACATEFKSKDRINLSDVPISFNGVRVSINHGIIQIEQSDKIHKLAIPADQKGFDSQRAMAQYVGVNCRPDVCANVQLIASGAENSSKEESDTLERVIKYLKATDKQGLHYIKLDLPSVKIAILSDASFANARMSRSQLGYIILMLDKHGRCNIIHFASNRCRRVTRSVMAAELHALILAFDFGFVIRQMLEETLGRKISIEAFLDSKTVFDVVARDGKTTERRLQIDVHALQQSKNNGELARIAWIPGPTNPADMLTKVTIFGKKKKDGTLVRSPLEHLMTTNRFIPEAIGWADKFDKPCVEHSHT